MKISKQILKLLVKNYHSEWDFGHPNIISDAGSDEHQYEYGKLQLRTKIVSGIGIDLYAKNVLEIGCGHGGICVYAAMVGARSVVGIDLSDSALMSAELLKTKIEEETNFELPLQFKKMEAEKLHFDENELDVIIADNVLEHVSCISEVLNECNRVLVKGGKIIVPNFPSYLSKFGPHVKYGIKIPWVHIFFSQKTIVQQMHELAKTDPLMYEFYPGLKNNAVTFKEVRQYNDLNYISNRKFKKAAILSGFRIENFIVTRPKWAWLLMKLVPFLQRTSLDDILSIGTSAILVKK